MFLFPIFEILYWHCFRESDRAASPVLEGAGTAIVVQCASCSGGSSSSASNSCQFSFDLTALVCHAGADAILAHQRAPSPAHLRLAGGFQPKPDNSPERTVSPVLVLGWIPLG
jgi:hypothetical protein